MMLISSVWAVILWSTSLRSLWPTLMDIPFPFARSLTLSRVLAGSFFFILFYFFILVAISWSLLCFWIFFLILWDRLCYCRVMNIQFWSKTIECMHAVLHWWIYIFLSVYSICKFHGKFIYIYIHIYQIPYMWEKRIPVHVITLSLFNNNNNNHGIIPNSMTFILCGSYFTLAD